MSVGTRELAEFENSRARSEAIAYRLLGSASDAEDAVQDTFLRWHAADHEFVETPAAWLTKVLTNICLNQLTSARVRREAYVGQWLPEPVFATDPIAGPADTVEQRESVSIAGRLAKRLHPADVDITLVNADPEFVERVRMHQLAAGQDLTSRLLTEVFAGTGVRVRLGRVTAIDVDHKTVAVDDSNEIAYDTLVYALGSAAASGAPGVTEHA
ncbi:sigma factor [Nocardia sp. NPDC050378]|uniref:sigma factor n=1 Tax=Nocardia sp. NPDC050378 TaxID=3155400 RepID=UPI00340203DA